MTISSLRRSRSLMTKPGFFNMNILQAAVTVTNKYLAMGSILNVPSAMTNIYPSEC